MLFCSSNEPSTQIDQFISRFRRYDHTATCWSHVDVVVVTVHVLRVLATPVLVTRYCELSCGDVMSHRSFRDVFCSLGGDDLPHPSSDHTKLQTGPPGLAHDSPRTPNVHISGHLRFKTPPKFYEKTPRETQKERNGGGKGKKKREILGLHPFGAPPSGPHPFGAPPFGAPFWVEPREVEPRWVKH